MLLHQVSNLATAVLVPLFIASWWQDWRSARAATSYYSAELVGFDVLTAGNYVGLANGWRLPTTPEQVVSTATLAHWTAIFAIYIVWNLALIREADEPTRKAFIKFNIAELPLVILGIFLLAARLFELHMIRLMQSVGIAILALAHLILLVSWRVMSRGGSNE